MTHMEIQAPARIGSNGYKVDVSRGQRIGRVSSEWFNRPDDERYLSLTDLNHAVRRRSERPICVSCRQRSPASICNMAFPRTAPSRSKRWRSKTAVLSFERLRARITGEFSTTS